MLSLLHAEPAPIRRLRVGIGERQRCGCHGEGASHDSLGVTPSDERCGCGYLGFSWRRPGRDGGVEVGCQMGWWTGERKVVSTHAACFKSSAQPWCIRFVPAVVAEDVLVVPPPPGTVMLPAPAAIRRSMCPCRRLELAQQKTRLQVFGIVIRESMPAARWCAAACMMACMRSCSSPPPAGGAAMRRACCASTPADRSGAEPAVP